MKRALLAVLALAPAACLGWSNQDKSRTVVDLRLMDAAYTRLLDGGVENIPPARADLKAAVCDLRNTLRHNGIDAGGNAPCPPPTP